VKTYAVAVGVVEHKGKILLLKRSATRRSNPNKWQTIGGHIQEHEAAEDAVLREVKEETGLTGKIIRAGDIFQTVETEDRWMVAAYLIEVDSTAVHINQREHSEFAWVAVSEIKHYDYEKGLPQDLAAVGIQF
jgi:8-oxo-dGTP diphosphatase